MNAGTASKKIAIWGSIVLSLILFGISVYAWIDLGIIPQYEESLSPLMIFYVIFGLLLYATPSLSIVLGIIGLFGKEKQSAVFGILYSLAFICIASFLSWYGSKSSRFETAPKAAEQSSRVEGASSANHDYFAYKIQSDTFKFITPTGFGDATSAYSLITEHPDLQFSLVCYFTTIENIRIIASGKQIFHPNFVKIDILKESKSNKVSKQEFKAALTNIKKTLPEALKRSSLSAQESFEIVKEQTKKFHGEDSNLEVVSTTNLGYIHSQDDSLLWTQLMPYDLTIGGETKRINAMAVLGMFYLNGRAFYITSVREFKPGTALHDLETWTVDYLKEIQKVN